MNPDSAFAVPPHVVARRIGDETVILDLASGTYFGLDPVGARAWELIAEGRSLGAVCAVLLQEYEVAQERLEQDIRDLVRNLQAHGLLL